jgi:hypothetical protein
VRQHFYVSMTSALLYGSIVTIMLKSCWIFIQCCLRFSILNVLNSFVTSREKFSMYSDVFHKACSIYSFIRRFFYPFVNASPLQITNRYPSIFQYASNTQSIKKLKAQQGLKELKQNIID